ncbi:unnamed protein product [Lactuca virosa]|uniref:Uncharacterized protein n=1 Tax=Lactuca virosa TaxID=75947 RepID=A0AAU9MF67_9ASTR|nr:unnamed protein product [Lactuca virosa]
MERENRSSFIDKGKSIARAVTGEGTSKVVPDKDMKKVKIGSRELTRMTEVCTIIFVEVWVSFKAEKSCKIFSSNAGIQNDLSQGFMDEGKWDEFGNNEDGE